MRGVWERQGGACADGMMIDDDHRGIHPFIVVIVVASASRRPFSSRIHCIDSSYPPYDTHLPSRPPSSSFLFSPHSPPLLIDAYLYLEDDDDDQ